MSGSKTLSAAVPLIILPPCLGHHVCIWCMRCMMPLLDPMRNEDVGNLRIWISGTKTWKFKSSIKLSFCQLLSWPSFVHFPGELPVQFLQKKNCSVSAAEKECELARPQGVKGVTSKDPTTTRCKRKTANNRKSINFDLWFWHSCRRKNVTCSGTEKGWTSEAPKV